MFGVPGEWGSLYLLISISSAQKENMMAPISPWELSKSLEQNDKWQGTNLEHISNLPKSMENPNAVLISLHYTQWTDGHVALCSW